ncbi:MAG TPA: MgtC/SapB family protein [Xanthomonadaceae bacterium]|jgi:putative Mg2+ transporter-C (MgtC) family protein|nr:MgtC/SapB family protein [Thermomonas hydrothermalis]
MNMPTDLTAALAAEFAMPGASVMLVSSLRLLLAAVLGGAIGYEREKKERSAGLKTHILVSVGSALFVMAPLYAGVSQADNTRVVQGVVSGIGFLGAGAILKLQRDMRVEGLTTAASIWLTSAIGVAAGLGNALLAIIATGVALFVTAVIPRLVPDGGRK